MITEHPEQLSPLELRVYLAVRRCRERLRLKREHTVPTLRHAKRIHVIARNSDWFLEYVKRSGRNLQDCNFLDTVEKMQSSGVGFSNPMTELVLVAGWTEGQAGNEQWVEAGYRVIARYCLDKRTNTVPTFYD